MSMDRRVFIASLGTLALVPPVLASEVQQVPKDGVVGYLSMSAFLLGTEKFKLSPRIAPDNLSPESVYYLLVQKAFGNDNFQRLLDIYQEKVMSHASPEEIAAAILLKAPPQLAAISRIAMKVWLYGVWFGAAGAEYIVDKDYASDMVVSSRAYATSVSWKIAQAHPMGYSNFAFGTWGEAPPPMSL